MDPKQIRELSSPELKDEYLDRPRTWGLGSQHRAQKAQLVLLLCASLALLGFGLWGAFQPAESAGEATSGAANTQLVSNSPVQSDSKSPDQPAKTGEGSFAGLSQKASVLAASPFAQASREKDEAPNCQIIRRPNPFLPARASDNATQSPSSNSSAKSAGSETKAAPSKSSSASPSAGSSSGSSSSSSTSAPSAHPSSPAGSSPVKSPAPVQEISCSISSSSVGNPVSAYRCIAYYQGMTAYDALLEMGLSVNSTNTAYGIYVRSIGGLAEKEHGALSGWMYSVNGSSPNCSCAAFELKPGDRLTWYYVK